MYSMKTKITTLLLLACSTIFATYQHGEQFVDTIALNNSTHEPITVHVNPSSKTIIAPGQTKNIPLDHMYNYFVIRQAKSIYHIMYENYNVHQAVGESWISHQLDFGTIAWLAAQQSSKSRKSLDQINIQNDLLYKIALIWKWNQTRSRPQIVEPDETISRVVREERPLRSGIATGELLLSMVDTNNKKYTVPFIRRALSPQDAATDNAWHEVTLSANTLIAFYNGTYHMKAETV